MRQRLFLHYGWFLQNLEKGCIRTNMHTTVLEIYNFGSLIAHMPPIQQAKRTCNTPICNSLLCSEPVLHARTMGSIPLTNHIFVNSYSHVCNKREVSLIIFSDLCKQADLLYFKRTSQNSQKRNYLGVSILLVIQYQISPLTLKLF